MKTKILLFLMLLALGAFFIAGCQQPEPEVNKTAAQKAPPEVQDLTKNPQVPPAQAEYLMKGGNVSKPSGQ